jgi:uncharacterized ion transporter superfamily protein YfcC
LLTQQNIATRGKRRHDIGVNKPSRFPHSLVLIFAMVIVSQLLTLMLPKGEFKQEPIPSAGTAYTEVEGEQPLRERLAAARERSGLAPEVLGLTFGVSGATVLGWENGTTHIEKAIGGLLSRWANDASVPTAAEITSWKTTLPAPGTKQLVVPGTYAVDDTAENLPWHSSLTKIATGMSKGGEIIFFVFMVGGVIGILRATGSIDALIGRAIAAFANRPIPLIAGMTLLFAIGSSTIGMAEEYMPFIPLLVTLSLALKMDAVVALGIVYIGAGVGYGCAALNPFTVLVAQEVAGVAPASGALFRVIFMLAAVAIGVLHITRYARRIQKDPTRSLVRDIDYSKGYETPTDVRLTPSRIAVLGLFVAAIVLIVYGVGVHHWWFDYLMAVFLGLGILAAIVGRISPNTAANKFCEGAAEMTTTALLIGVARTIEVVLDEGMVIHTIINGIAETISGAGPYLASLGMLAVQSVANVLIPSGSGQAYVTMPVMAPLSDLCGISRQTAVLAYQIGDGFMNMIVPTNALLMGMLALARIPFGRWVRFILPLMFQLYLLAAGAMFVAWMIDY